MLANAISSDDEMSANELLEDEIRTTLKYQRIGVDLQFEPDQSHISFHLSRIEKLENFDKVKETKDSILNICSTVLLYIDLYVDKLARISNLIHKIEALENFQALETLELYQNRVKVIENLNHLQQLQTLDLSFNRIKKIQNLEALVNLTQLFLSSNRISKIENLELLTKLEHLELGSNNIRLVENIDTLSKLTQLWLGKNKITRMELPFLPLLKSLSFQCNRLQEWNSELFHQCPELDEAYFSENQLPDPPKDILQWKSLRVLDLAKNKVTSLEVISQLTNLTELWLNDNQISSLQEVDHLKKLHHLETLYLERNPLQENLGPGYRTAILSRLATLSQLDALLV